MKRGAQLCAALLAAMTCGRGPAHGAATPGCAGRDPASAAVGLARVDGESRRREREVCAGRTQRELDDLCSALDRMWQHSLARRAEIKLPADPELGRLLEDLQAAQEILDPPRAARAGAWDEIRSLLARALQVLKEKMRRVRIEGR